VRESQVVELQKREEERKKEGLQPAALLPYATAALRSNERWKLSGCDPPPCYILSLSLII
jgi:hypothetical protein